MSRTVVASRSKIGEMYAIGVMAFILFLSTLVGAPVLPRLAVELEAPEEVIPLVVSASLATVVVAQFFTGVLADRYSRRLLILSGALLGSVSSLLILVATHWSQLLLLRVLGGVADAAAMPALLAITASLGKDQPGRFFGILRSSQGLSFVAGPLLGGAFSLLSPRTPFLIDGVLSLFAFLAALFLVGDAKGGEQGHRFGVFHGLRMTFGDRRIFLYLLLGVSGLFGFGILNGFVPTKAQTVGLGAWQIGLIMGFGALVYSVVCFGVGNLSDRFGRQAFAIVSQLVIVGSTVALAFLGRGFVSLTTLYALFCVGEATAYLLCFAYASEVFDEAHLGTAMGAFDSLIDLSLLVGPAVGVVVYGLAGEIKSVFLLACVPAAAGLFGTAFWLGGVQDARHIV